ncbi:hypothetical protein LPJ68_003036 [Coemansia sp. RSA 1086]|nr:hypothetical protein LPJ68_003036 [Coemansia sp. RSA 1086]
MVASSLAAEVLMEEEEEEEADVAAAMVAAEVVEGFKCKRSVESMRQNAVQAAIDETEEEDGFIVIGIDEKRTVDSSSPASMSSDMSTLSQTQYVQTERAA